MNWKPSTCGMPRSATTTSGTSVSRLLSASSAERAVLTRAPAACEHLGHQRQRIRLVVDREHVDAAQIRQPRTVARSRLASRMDARALRRGRDGRSSAGSSRGTSRPWSTPPLETSIVPPCISISCRAIDRPRPSPPRSRRDAGVRLAEPLEDVRQELRRDADAGVADDDFDVRVDALEPHLHLAAAVRELHAHSTADSTAPAAGAPDRPRSAPPPDRAPSRRARPWRRPPA